MKGESHKNKTRCTKFVLSCAEDIHPTPLTGLVTMKLLPKSTFDFKRVDNFIFSEYLFRYLVSEMTLPRT